MLEGTVRWAEINHKTLSWGSPVGNKRKGRTQNEDKISIDLIP